MPTRTYAHVIDTKAIKKVLNSLPDTWVVRELTERDYGTDLQVEIFRENGKDANSKIKYETSGCLLNLQVKGADKNLKLSKKNTVDVRLHRNNLLYFEKFSVPFILVRVDVSDKKTDSYFIWLQKYIKHKLDRKHPNWRDEDRLNDDGEIIEPNYKIEIPENNTLIDSLDKLKRISARTKFVEEMLEYIEVFSGMRQVMESIDDGGYCDDDASYDELALKARGLSRLSTLFEYNTSMVNRRDLKNLQHHLLGFKTKNQYSTGKIMEFTAIDKLTMLLEAEANTILLVEELSIELTNETPF